VLCRPWQVALLRKGMLAEQERVVRLGVVVRRGVSPVRKTTSSAFATAAAMVSCTANTSSMVPS